MKDPWPQLQRLWAPGMRVVSSFACAHSRHMVLERVLAQRFKLCHGLPAHRYRERRRDADVLQHVSIVVQTEEQRTHGVFSAFVPTESRDNAIGGARVPHFDQHA